MSTPQSHLQPTTCLAVDLTSNFLLSGSPDSNIHFWSIPSLLSFLASSSSSTKDSSQPLPFSPLQTFSDHRAPINALQFGHSPSLANIAVSASADSTCIVWDYNSGIALHTFLLPVAPLCLTLDPADRAVYAGYDDGSVQLIDFYARPSLTNPLYDPALRSTPTQPPATHRWPSPGENPSPILALQVSHDGTTVLSGHQNGRIQTWDVANGRFATQLADLALPITNLLMLPPTGFPNPTVAPLKLHTVVKPRYESSLNGTNATAANALVPPNYTLTAQFTSTLPSSPSSSSSSSQPSIFHQALSSPSFPPSLLEASIAAFASAPSLPPSSNDLAAQNAVLVEQLNAALHQQRSAMKELLVIDRDRYEKAEEAKAKRGMKRRRRERRAEVERRRRRVVMGEEPEGDIPMEKDKESEDEGLSSSTDEITETE